MSTSRNSKDLEIIDYSDRSFAVYGNTKDHKQNLKSLGGKYNSSLKDGPGWIFSKSRLTEVTDYVETGNLNTSDSPRSRSLREQKPPKTDNGINSPRSEKNGERKRTIPRISVRRFSDLSPQLKRSNTGRDRHEKPIPDEILFSLYKVKDELKKLSEKLEKVNSLVNNLLTTTLEQL